MCCCVNEKDLTESDDRMRAKEGERERAGENDEQEDFGPVSGFHAALSHDISFRLLLTMSNGMFRLKVESNPEKSVPFLPYKYCRIVFYVCNTISFFVLRFFRSMICLCDYRAYMYQKA